MRPIYPRDTDLSALRLFSKRMAVVGRRLAWLTAMQRRTTNVASLLRMLPRLLGRKDARRAKVDGAWIFTVDDTDVLAVVVRTPGRNIEQLLARLPVRVLDPSVDLGRLAELEQRGLGTILAEGRAA